MYILSKKLKNLPVYTKSKEYLGKIQEIEIDLDNQNIVRYLVKSNQMVKRLVGKQLIIKPPQVLSLDEEKMVVEDNIIKEKKAGLVREPATLS
ncbi:PRC-barrel domain-containing protein [Patescibacteria group bacterium]|nr:PRC-barrel domain-containing protein [Patescibacteria group bacterium]